MVMPTRLKFRAIREVLVAAIHEHNELHNVSHLLTRDMVRSNVQATPAAIYNWGMKCVRGRSPVHVTPDSLAGGSTVEKNTELPDSGGTSTNLPTGQLARPSDAHAVFNRRMTTTRKD